MRNIVLAVLTSTLLAGAAFADHANDENHEGDGGSPTVTVTNTNTAVATAVQSQGQEQGQFQAQGNVQKLEIEDAKNPASSAANLFLANCTSGASGQGFGGGGSIGGPDEVCLLMNLAVVSASLGDVETSTWALGEAKLILRFRTNPFLRVFQAIPIVRRIF